MPLLASRLSASLETGIESAYGLPQDPSKLKAFCDAVADAIVTEIQDNAVVLPGTFANVAGPIGGTGTVT